MLPKNYSKSLLAASLREELKKLDKPYKVETIFEDLSSYKVKEYIYISSFKNKHDLTYNETIKILNIFLKKNILREIFIVSFSDKWLGEYYSIADIPLKIYDEEAGIDLEVTEDHIFTCFEVINSVK